MSPDSKDIKFPTHHYIGFQTRPDEDGVPLGFMTPDGTDDAAKKRKATVDSWSRGSGYSAANKGSLPAKTLENKPMNGFKLGRNIRHSSGGWGQGNVKWRIEDPRGFELEITSPNLAQILACTTVENGEILEQCMWARLKADNVLVPVSSDVYKAALANTERLNKSAKMSDIKPGDYAVLQNGAEGLYMGHYYLGSDGLGRYGNLDKPSLDKKYHLFLLEPEFRHKTYGDKSTRQVIRTIADPKLSEIRPSETPWTLEDAEAKVLEYIKNGGDFEAASSSYGYTPDFVVAVQAKKPKDTIRRVLEPLALSSLLSGTKQADKLMIVAKSDAEWFIASANSLNPAQQQRWHQGKGDFEAPAFDMESYEREGLLQTLQEPAYSGYYRTFSARSDGSKQIGVERSKVDPAGFAIRVEGKTPLGNDISYLA